ncbi:MAG: hypothetical protein RL594_715 [Bacteroidota bacterium]
MCTPENYEELQRVHAMFWVVLLLTSHSDASGLYVHVLYHLCYRRMNRCILGTLLLVALTTTSYGQVSLIKNFGGTDRDAGKCIAYRPGGGWYTASDAGSNDVDFLNMRHGYLLDIAVSKFAEDGTAEWHALIGGTNHEQAYQIIPDTDGGCVVAGFSLSVDNDLENMSIGARDIFVFKLDANGEIVWKHTYGGSGNDLGLGMAKTGDGGWVVTGTTNSNDVDFDGMARGGNDLFVMRLNATGDLLWTTVIGGTLDDVGNDIDVRDDGVIAVTGYTQSNDGDFAGMNNGGADIIVMTLNDDGTLRSTDLIGGIADDVGQSIRATDEGDWVLAGDTRSNDDVFQGIAKGGRDAFVMKIHDDATIAWTSVIGGTSDDFATHVLPALDGGYVMTGAAGSNTGDWLDLYKGGAADICVVKIDATGQIQWKRVIGGGGNEYGNSLAIAADGQIGATGISGSNTGDFTGMRIGNFDAFLVHVDDDVCSLSITSQPISPTVQDGQQTVLTVTATADAPITYQWQRKVGSAFENVPDNAQFMGGTTSKLTIESAQLARKGPYRCVVTSGTCNRNSEPATLTVTCQCGQ